MRTLSVWLLSICCLLAQQTDPAKPKEPTEAEKEEIASGAPIKSELVRKTCSPCHKVRREAAHVAHLLAADDS